MYTKYKLVNRKIKSGYSIRSFRCQSRRVLDLYDQKIKIGVLKSDPNQKNTIVLLQKIYDDLMDYDFESVRQNAVEEKSDDSMMNKLSSWFSAPPPKKEEKKVEKVPKGIYMYGDVGSGKTMLMDLLLEALPSNMNKKRTHFNSFMAETHRKIHEERQRPEFQGKGQTPVIQSVARSILKDSSILAFDEFQVTDIADAMILQRLFKTMWDAGTVVIITSNRIPNDLYKGGIQRESFLPFISSLKENCEIHRLSSINDYRMTGIKTDQIFNVGPTAQSTINSLWNTLTDNRPGKIQTLKVNGRTLQVNAFKGIARFHFDELCRQPLGASDYAKIGSTYDTVFIEGIPKMDLDMFNVARRFITLIDEFYQFNVKVICAAETEPEGIFPQSFGKVGKSETVALGEEETFAFSRVVSRLHEMQSVHYLERKHINKQ